ncbi:hypothetical protein DFH09DRAFT_1089022 [Mycena vulgaris]|nr:hypothetical protein DFH09DRAFT_1089022 [Mycena vulgaris]
MWVGLRTSGILHDSEAWSHLRKGAKGAPRDQRGSGDTLPTIGIQMSMDFENELLNNRTFLRLREWIDHRVVGRYSARWLVEANTYRRADKEGEGHSEILGFKNSRDWTNGVLELREDYPERILPDSEAEAGVHTGTREGQGRTGCGVNASSQAKMRGRIHGRTGTWRARIGKERDSGRETGSRDDCVGSRDAGEGRDAQPTLTRLNSSAHGPDSQCIPVSVSGAVLPMAACARAVASVRASRLAPTSFMPNTSQYRAPGLQLKGCQLLNFNFLEHPTPEARNPEATLDARTNPRTFAASPPDIDIFAASLAGHLRTGSAVFVSGDEHTRRGLDCAWTKPYLDGDPLFLGLPPTPVSLDLTNEPRHLSINAAHMSLSFESKTPIRPALMIILPPSHQRASRSLDSDTGNEGGSIGRACSDIDPRRHKARQAFPSPTATIRKAYRLSCLRAPPVHGTLSPFVDEAWDNMLPLWCKDARLSSWAPDYTGSRATGISPTANFSLPILSHAAPTTDDASPPPRKLPPTLATLPVSRGSGSGDAPTKPSLQCDAFPLSVFSHSLAGPLVASSESGGTLHLPNLEPKRFAGILQVLFHQHLLLSLNHSMYCLQNLAIPRWVGCCF